MLKFIKKYAIPIFIFLFFEIIGVVFWRMWDFPFYYFNFTYIGFFVSLTIAMMLAGKKNARVISEFAVGLYMFVFLGIISRENMALEGFFYFAAMGIFQAAVIHYFVAKIAGPLVFGRAWCGYACWTAMILDVLPFGTPGTPRKKKLGILRLVIFALTLAYFCVIWFLYRDNIDEIMYVSFAFGNMLYYMAGILLAFRFKDNRAFCKYLCPVTVFLKPASFFSLLRIRYSEEKCIRCGKCVKVCPMDVDMMNDKRTRKNGTECIQCLKCVHECPQKALSWKMKAL